MTNKLTFITESNISPKDQWQGSLIPTNQEYYL